MYRCSYGVIIGREINTHMVKPDILGTYVSTAEDKRIMSNFITLLNA